MIPALIAFGLFITVVAYIVGWALTEPHRTRLQMYADYDQREERL